MSNISAYTKLNQRTLEYVNKINRGILEEGYILCERVMELQDRFLAPNEESESEFRG